MYNKYENEPIQSEKKSIMPKILFLIVIIVVIIISTIFYLINSLKRYSDVDYVEFGGMQIPTIYKYTNYEDVFLTRKIENLFDGNVSGSYVVIFYNSKIPNEYKDTYAEELKKLGYEKVIYNDAEFYVRNIENDTKFLYVMLSNLQIKYGICTSGRYEDILK